MKRVEGLGFLGAALLGAFISAGPLGAATIGTPRSITVGSLPDDASILYWSTRNEFSALGPSNLYVTNLTGSRVTQMTFSAKPYEHAGLSSDRRYIAANRLANGISSLWIIDLKNRTEAQLVPEHRDSGGGGMDWSPDGFIFFSSAVVSGGDKNIYKIKPDGTQLTQLTFLVVSPNTTPPDPAVTGDVSVSDDGSLVAYARTVASVFPDDSWGPKTQVWIMNSDGTNQHLLYDDGRPGGMSGDNPIGVFDPEISPDNTKVVFSRTNTDYFNFPSLINSAQDLYVINVDGTGLTLVTAPGPISVISDWQNGKLVYTEYWDGAALGGSSYTGPVVVNPDGTGKTRLESGGLALWRGGRHSKFFRPTTDPLACSGQWTNCSQADTNDSNRSTSVASNNSQKTGVWNNYGFALPSTATIHWVTVLATFYASNSNGFIEVRVSTDGGVTYGPAHTVGGNTSDQTFLIDVTTDAAWTPTLLNNSNLRVQVKSFKQGSSSGNPTCNLGWVPVKVSYSP